MSWYGGLAYAAQVGVGYAALRYERMQSTRKLARPWRHAHLSPPVGTSPWLKELISRHYLRGRYANLHTKVAWVSSGAPTEFLVALGYHVHYPENHGAVCGIRRTSEALCSRAEDEGFSRDICSYARTDFGTVFSGKTPVGRLPRPDLLVCCTNICQTLVYWYQVLAHHFDVPLVVIDTPFVYREVGEHALTFVVRQIEHAIEVAERVAGRSLAPRELENTTQLGKDACELWLQVMQTGRARPAPITAFDEFIHMAPIVEMRGYGFTVDYYAALLAELKDRIARGVGALKVEKKRLIWDNLPIWPRLRWMSERLATRQVALVASTYTNAWGELAPLIDAARPLESAAQVYIHPILNRGTGHKLATLKGMLGDYEADGVILHSDRSCKPYSIGQKSQRDALSDEAGVPALLFEADHNDPRAFAEEQAATRLDAFFEMLGA